MLAEKADWLDHNRHPRRRRSERQSRRAADPTWPAGGGGALLLMSRMLDVDWSTLGPLYSRTSDQRSDQAQQFLFFWPATSRNKKGFDLNISDLAISYCTTS
jgi:hypothetical protein